MKLSLLICGIVVILIIVINLFVSLVMLIAEEQHVVDQVKIYQVFEQEKYLKIKNSLMKSNYTILVGDNQSGVKNYIEHQSNIQTLAGKAVILKRYQSTGMSKQQILKKIKQTRFYLEMAFGLDRQARTEVFFIDNDVIPLEQIKFVKQKYEEDHIVLVSPKHLQIEGFKTIVFPRVEPRDLFDTLKEYYNMGKNEARAFMRSQNYSIEKIFNFFKRKAKREDGTYEEFIEVDDIEDLNKISEKLEAKKIKRIKQLTNNFKSKKSQKTQKKQSKKSKKNKQL